MISSRAASDSVGAEEEEDDDDDDAPPPRNSLALHLERESTRVMQEDDGYVKAADGRWVSRDELEPEAGASDHDMADAPIPLPRQ